MAYSPKVIALAQFLNVSLKKVNAPDESSDACEAFTADGEPGEYLVLTDDEADRACDEQLDQYIDDCILPEIPEAYRTYFDREAWKRDAKLSDGRGHTLSSYDGEEHEERVLTNDGPVYFYIYRVN
jgi:hypothetical protein